MDPSSSGTSGAGTSGGAGDRFNIRMSREEMLSQVVDWNLGCDTAVLNRLKDFSENMLKRAEVIKEDCNSCANQTELLQTKVQNVTNQFLILANDQFVENCVEDFEETDAAQTSSSPLVHQVKTKAEKEAELILKMKESIQIGIASNSLSDNTSDISSSAPNFPKLKTAHLIGTSKFFSSRFCGLIDESQLRAGRLQKTVIAEGDQNPINITESVKIPKAPSSIDSDYINQTKDNLHIPNNPRAPSSLSSEDNYFGASRTPLTSSSNSLGTNSNDADLRRHDEVPVSRPPISIIDDLNKVLSARVPPPPAADSDSDDDFKPPQAGTAQRNLFADVDDEDIFGVTSTISAKQISAKQEDIFSSAIVPPKVPNHFNPPNQNQVSQLANVIKSQQKPPKLKQTLKKSIFDDSESDAEGELFSSSSSTSSKKNSDRSRNPSQPTNYQSLFTEPGTSSPKILPSMASKSDPPSIPKTIGKPVMPQPSQPLTVEPGIKSKQTSATNSQQQPAWRQKQQTSIFDESDSDDDLFGTSKSKFVGSLETKSELFSSEIKHSKKQPVSSTKSEVVSIAPSQEIKPKAEVPLSPKMIDSATEDKLFSTQSNPLVKSSTEAEVPTTVSIEPTLEIKPKSRVTIQAAEEFPEPSTKSERPTNLGLKNEHSKIDETATAVKHDIKEDILSGELNKPVSESASIPTSPVRPVVEQSTKAPGGVKSKLNSGFGDLLNKVLQDPSRPKPGSVTSPIRKTPPFPSQSSFESENSDSENDSPSLVSILSTKTIEPETARQAEAEQPSSFDELPASSQLLVSLGKGRPKIKHERRKPSRKSMFDNEIDTPNPSVLTDTGDDLFLPVGQRKDLSEKSGSESQTPTSTPTSPVIIPKSEPSPFTANAIQHAERDLWEPRVVADHTVNQTLEDSVEDSTLISSDFTNSSFDKASLSPPHAPTNAGSKISKKPEEINAVSEVEASKPKHSVFDDSDSDLDIFSSSKSTPKSPNKGSNAKQLTNGVPQDKKSVEVFPEPSPLPEPATVEVTTKETKPSKIGLKLKQKSIFGDSDSDSDTGLFSSKKYDNPIKKTATSTSKDLFSNGEKADSNLFGTSQSNHSDSKVVPKASQSSTNASNSNSSSSAKSVIPDKQSKKSKIAQKSIFDDSDSDSDIFSSIKSRNKK